jgi:membrane fusion protein, multidrug efflux system
MDTPQDPCWLRILGRTLGWTIIISAVVMGCHITHVTYVYPRTDDATVTANVVGIAPHVSGALVELKVAEDQQVNARDLMFTIDPQPYQARVASANAALMLARSDLDAMSNSIAAAISVVNVRKAELDLAVSDLNRYEPLLKFQAVDQITVDEARTRQRTAQAQFIEAQQNLLQQQNLLGQFGSLNVRIAAAEDVLHTEQLNLDYCRVSAPFSGRVANLSISAGEYARQGEPIFAFVDTRRWYVVANFRETFLDSIRPGQDVDVYLMPYPHRRFHGVVQGIGWAIQTQDSAPNGTLMGVKPTLNWIRLAQRIPVRILLDAPDLQHPYRMGMTAVVTVRPQPAPTPVTANSASP